MAPERIHFLNGAAPDLEAECARYERAIAAAGGIDLQILGIGTNGHIGFNEPARALMARTHKVELKAETRRSNAALFGGDADARAARSAVDGDGDDPSCPADRPDRDRKVEGAGDSSGWWTGPITPKLPASFLELHGNVDLWLDGPAASQLPRRAADYFVFEQLPEAGLDVFADRLAHRVVGLAQPLHRLRHARARSSASRSRP